MHRSAIVLCAGLLALASGLEAGDVEKGQKKAALCAACHGPKGVSRNPLWPNLAGQKEQYLVRSITEFRDGKRTDPTMQPMLVNLSDEDIADLAAFYAAQKNCD